MQKVDKDMLKNNSVLIKCLNCYFENSLYLSDTRKVLILLLLSLLSYYATFAQTLNSNQIDSLPVNVKLLGKNINTEYSEFNAIQIEDSILFFSALRPVSKSGFRSLANLEYRTVIYSTEIRVSGFQETEEISRKINRKNTHNANIALDRENNRAFFTRCYDETGHFECDIMAVYYDNGRWKRPFKLPNNINIEGYTSTQPHYSKLGDYGVLYFVSDRPGGFGGMDIWYSIESETGFSEPVNCGSIINTPGNEVTPFYDTARDKLFFSSDYHPGSGGYDIFNAEGGLASWRNVENVGIPINSPYNDYYYTINTNDSNGYFVSNRPITPESEDTCCNNIYRYEWIPKELPVEIVEVDEPEEPEEPNIQEKAMRLLPIILFFDNDRPDPATMSITSSIDYKTSLDQYMERLSVYKKEYSAGLDPEAAKQATKDIENFFQNYVNEGYKKLQMLTDYLLEDLNNGNTVQLLVSGYCSPLSTTEYNINLARRRINSLIKYLENFNNGALTPYLNKTAENNAELIIFEDPVGKEMASPFVSDNPHDKRNSVYSRAAAFERRVEIAVYVSHKPDEMILLSELPTFEIPNDTVNVGKLKKGERKVVTVDYTNNGHSELLIRRVVFNKLKLSVEWSNEPLLPKNKGRIIVLVNPGKRKGEFMENITIESNLPYNKTITIVGYVE